MTAELASYATTQRTVLDRLQSANGRTVGLDVLADLLFGEHTQETRVGVRTVIHRLRRRGYRIDTVTLRQFGAPASSGYRLLPDGAAA